jgi:hypothetical protein
VARRTPAVKHLTAPQVVDRLMQIIDAAPEVAAGLPEKYRSRSHWRKTFAQKTDRARNVLEVLSELPAFTVQAPRKASREAWRKVFASHQGIEQIRYLLGEIEKVANAVPVKRRKIVRWRDAYSEKQVVQRIRPPRTDAYLPNPHRGTTTFQRFQGDPLYPGFSWSDTHGPVEFPHVARIADNAQFIPRTTLTYCRWPWSWLEPEKGKFRWEIIDGTLKTARARGQTAQLRFQPYTARVDHAEDSRHRHPPISSVNVPDWFWDSGASWIDQGANARNEPDINDAKYIGHFGDFVRAFAARYDGHPDLESIDIAYGGKWGESGGNATDATAECLVGIYTEHFRRTPLLAMIGTPGCRIASRSAGDRSRPIGWRADCYGHWSNNTDSPEVPYGASWNHTFDMYPEAIADGLTDLWKTAPVTMETCWTVAGWAMYGYDIDRIIEDGYRYHTSVFMPKSVFFPERMLEKLIVFDKRIGYRYELRQILLSIEAKRGATIRAEVLLDNVGCAPIYRPYRLALRLKQGKKTWVVPFAADVRTWLPGQTFFREELAVPAGLQPGEAAVAIGIVDHRDAPRVWFAIDDKLDDGWHPLTSVDVV